MTAVPTGAAPHTRPLHADAGVRLLSPATPRARQDSAAGPPPPFRTAATAAAPRLPLPHVKRRRLAALLAC